MKNEGVSCSYFRGGVFVLNLMFLSAALYLIIISAVICHSASHHLFTTLKTPISYFTSSIFVYLSISFHLFQYRHLCLSVLFNVKIMLI